MSELQEARELLGKAHDAIARAVMDYSGGHQRFVGTATCGKINELIEQLNDACGACPMDEPYPITVTQNPGTVTQNPLLWIGPQPSITKET